ncbi:MAG: recombinase family protein [Neptuniibacter sp.]
MSKKAYLYTRVSSKEQASKGQGLRRQRELAEEFLKNHPEYKIHEIYEDAGKSAFYAKNLDNDAGLGGFIAAAENGDIEPDSLLVFETVCRLSRIGTKRGAKLISRIFDCKINIAVVKFNTIFFWDIDNDLSEAILLNSGLHLGKLESEQKSQRIKRTLDIQLEMARNSKSIFRPKSHPKWLEFDQHTQQYNVIAEKADIIKHTFYLRLKRALGISAIVDLLNEQDIKPISGRPSWSESSVNRLLRNRAVIGEYQPTEKITRHGKSSITPKGEPFKNYYPKVITAKEFATVQDSFSLHRQLQNQGSRSGNKNLFRHVSKCLLCSSSMTHKEGSLKCSAAPNHCKNVNTRYDDVERTLTEFFKSANFLKPLNKTQNGSLDLSDKLIREQYNGLLLGFIEYIKFYGDYILIKMKGVDLESIRHSKLPTIRVARDANMDGSLVDFIEALRSEEDIHIARAIYKRKVEEGLSRKQTTRLLTKTKINISEEQHRQIRKELGIRYREDLCSKDSE